MVTHFQFILVHHFTSTFSFPEKIILNREFAYLVIFCWIFSFSNWLFVITNPPQDSFPYKSVFKIFKKKVQTYSNRRLSASKCFASQFRRSALSGDFLRHEMKKAEVLKKNINIANSNKNRKINNFYNMFLCTYYSIH